MSADVRADALNSALKRQSFTFREARGLHQAGRLTTRGLETIVEASFLTTYASFESFLEELFYDCLLGTSGLPDSSALVDLADRDKAQAILTLNRPFVKWLPWNEGVARLAPLLLHEGGPFDRMARSTIEKSMLDEARLLRNAVAHDSGSAKAAVTARLATLPPRRKSVAWYLMSTPSAGMTRFEGHVVNIGAVARCLTASDVASAHRVLIDERPYLSGESAPRGTYRCERANHHHRVTRKNESLPACSACRAPKSKWQRQW